MKRPLPVLAVCAVLSGCAPSIETRIQSDGTGVSAPSAIALFVPEAGRRPVEAGLGPTLEKMLTAKGYMLTEAAPLILDYAVSERPATLGVAAAKADADGKQPWISKPRGTAGCKARIIRLTVSLARKADGHAFYRGSAEERHCRAKVESVLPALAAAALADLAAPAGLRLVKRPGQN